ncbi:hypothetical protein [Microcystis phage Mae-Yong1326-1]|nr:hypothetical protein [Microcystis phage Mae-Yong1326-1]
MLARFKQPSTWRGLALLGVALGATPEATAGVEAIGTGVVGAIGLWDLIRNGRTFQQAGLNG